MNTEDRVKKTIAECIGVKAESIQMGQRFAEHLGCDSLDMVELVMELENTFNIDIRDDKIDELVFVRQAVELVTELLGQKVAAAAPLATCGDNA